MRGLIKRSSLGFARLGPDWSDWRVGVKVHRNRYGFDLWFALPVVAVEFYFRLWPAPSTSKEDEG